MVVMPLWVTETGVTAAGVGENVTVAAVMLMVGGSHQDCEDPRAWCPGPRTTHLLGNSTDSLGGQIVERKHEPPVEVALPTQGSVVYICLLFVFFESHHPAGHTQERTVLISSKATDYRTFPTCTTRWATSTWTSEELWR